MKNIIKTSMILAIFAIAITSCIKDKDPVITITTQPAATITVTEGSITESLTVAATVTQSATLTYQWYSNATASNVGGTAVATGGASATFAIPTDLTAAQSPYYYFCEVRATGAETKHSNVATVTVTAAPPDGTADNPFIVTDETTLKKVGSGTDGWELSSHYRQTANITLSSEWTPIGNASNRFTGTYDGGGYSITNLTISSATTNYQGIFGYVGDVGVVKNVALINVSISATSNSFTGGIAGRNQGTIENCYVTGTVSGNAWVGGVAGYNISGTIKNCYSTCTVTSSDAAVGGIVGFNNSGTVEACYATGKITGTFNVGGIVGAKGSGGTLIRCVALNSEVYATNLTTTNVGRVVGSNSSSGLSNNYARETGMILENGSGAVTPTSNILGKDGLDISVLPSDVTYNIFIIAFWSSTFGSTNAALWDFSTTRLPHLKTTGNGTFNEPQSPTVLP